MLRFLFAIGFLFLSSGLSFAKLELKNIQMVHGPYGPERTSTDFYPYDEIYFRFTVHGIKTDADGKTKAELTVKLVNADGREVLNQKGEIQRKLDLGGDSFLSQAFITVSPKATPGEYKLSATLKDRISGESISFERQLTCQPISFQILMPRFYKDADAKITTSVGGIEGETLYFRLKVIGFDKKQKHVETTLTAQILDREGKEVLSKPVFVKAELKDGDDLEKHNQVTFNGSFYLNRTGEYRLRMIAEDIPGKQKTVFETPLKVTAP